MGEPSATSVGVAWAIKYYGWKLIGGAIAVSFLFLVLWPKTAKEGVARIAATILGSVVFGGTAVEAVRHYIPWLPMDTVEAQMPVFVLAGAPAWWVLGAVVRWMDARKEKDIGEILREVKQ